MTEYYTPEQIAYFLYEENYNITDLNNCIIELYEKEYSFIDRKYRKNDDIFLKETLEYYNYFIHNNEYEKQLLSENKINNHLMKYEKFTDTFFPNFFLITRLELLYKRKYRTIKLRTLLKKYGYKSRHSSVMMKFRDSINFYHLDTYKKGVNNDLFDFELDDMITFRIK